MTRIWKPANCQQLVKYTSETKLKSCWSSQRSSYRQSSTRSERRWKFTTKWVSPRSNTFWQRPRRTRESDRSRARWSRLGKSSKIKPRHRPLQVFSWQKTTFSTANSLQSPKWRTWSAQSMTTSLTFSEATFEKPKSTQIKAFWKRGRLKKLKYNKLQSPKTPKKYWLRMSLHQSWNQS